MSQTCLRICLVVGCDGWGGSEIQAGLLVDGLRASGHSVDVWLIEGGIEGGPLSQRGARTLGSARGVRLRQVGQTILGFMRLRRIIATIDYDVVHAIMARAYVIAPLVVASLRGAPPLVGWRRNRGVHLGSSRVGRAVERLAAHLSVLVLCNSEAVRQYWVREGLVAAQKARVVRNSLPDWRFEASAQPVDDSSSFRLISVGGLKPVKNHALLIEAVGRMSRHSLNVVILGSGDEHCSLARQASAEKVDLLLAGHVTDSRGWLESADIYVHPSSSEGLSNAILEAMAAGKAIVATDVGAASELLGSDRGVLVPPGDVSALVAALEHLLSDAGLRERLGLAARQWVGLGFSLSAVVDEHVRLYRCAIELRRSS